MKPIVIFAGTSEGRMLAEYLDQNKIDSMVCVATEYGERIMTRGEHMQIHWGRMDEQQMTAFLQNGGYETVVDATHPYAVEVSANIRKACAAVGQTYCRLVRDSAHAQEDAAIHYVKDVEEAAHFINETTGNVLLTTGSKELSKYAQIVEETSRLYARVLSVEASIKGCLELGFEGDRLICMQGPFSEEMNYALLKQVDARFLVTKESGAAGGFLEKIRAAKRAGVSCIIVGRPKEEQGYSLDELKQRFVPDGVNAQSVCQKVRKISLLGIGMGAYETMTMQAIQACENCDVILGASRMLDALEMFAKPVAAMWKAADITAYIKEHVEYDHVVVALSGDVGFYSGAKNIVAEFENEAGYQVEMICGLSSPVYFASKLNLSWDDMEMISLHGRKQNLIHGIKNHEKVFVLAGKAPTIREIAAQLCEYGFADIQMYVGTDLSYSNEQIKGGAPADFVEFDTDGLSVVILIRPQAKQAVCTHGIADGCFTRGEVPMTKEEVRSISLSKLRLTPDSIVYDVGAGTGSVSVECAVQAWNGTVYAVEQKGKAIDLLRENRKNFALPNLEIIEGAAPDALAELPAPSHVFVGGSSGKMRQILELIFAKNPKARVVVNAIALETVAETLNCIKTMEVEDTDVVTVSVGKSKTIAGYHMMMGQNPVYIISFQGV